MSRARDTADQINRVNSSAANATAITVDSSENVGIGESDPDSTLTVKGSAHTNFQVKSNSESTKAFIQTVQDSDVRIGSSTNHPVSFYQNGSERLRILSGGGLTFNGDTAAANALDDYEEGTFTPTVIFGSGSSGITYSVREGKYTKIGNIVQYYIQCSLSSKGSSTGNLSITGLPFTNTDTASPPSILTGAFTNTSDIQIYLNAGGATLNLENRNTGTQSPLSNSNVNNNSTMFIAGVYRTSQ